MQPTVWQLTNNWKWVAILLCVFGFFRELRPSEPFSTEFFIGWRNVTTDDVTRILYPIGTYSYLTQLVIVFLITDMLRYKAVIVYSAVVGIAMFSFMLWTNALYGLILAQICYGSFMAAEVAYYTYIYAKVEQSKYQLVTSHTRSAILAGRFLGSVVAQTVVSYNVMNYRELNFLSLGSQCISLMWAVLLPSVSASMYFYAKDDNDNHSGPVTDANSTAAVIAGTEEQSAHTTEKGDVASTDEKAVTPRFSRSKAFNILWMHFTVSYSNDVVIVWSIWWAIAMAGFLQVQSYIQLLWKDIYADEEIVYNGAIEAAITLLGALGALAAGFFDSSKLKRYDMLILTGCSVIEGGLLICAAYTNSLWTCYAMYILFGMLYHFMITVASATVAKQLLEDSFALIFGINTLMALILQSLLTYIAITELDLHIRVQYYVYGGYFFVLAAIYSVIYVVRLFVKK